MNSLVLEPHYDDAALFASFTLLREHPVVATAFAGADDSRVEEHAAAMNVLGIDRWEPIAAGTETEPDWQVLEDWLAGHRHRFQVVYAPLTEPRGHAQHNRVSDFAHIYFPPPKWELRWYLTYQHVGLPSPIKSRSKNEVPYEPEWLALKLRALACYQSQIENRAGSYRHFVEDLREYVSE